jgi:uncharacterized membrane protein
LRPIASHEERGLATLLAVSVLILLIAFPSAHLEAYTVTSILVDVSSDGYAKVSASITFNNSEGALVVGSLAAPDAYSIAATDSNNTNVPFSLNGTDIVLNVLVRTSPMTLTYSTPLLTAKSGAFWNLNITLSSAAEVILPTNASLISINRFPADISSSGNRVHLTLGNGTWGMVYFILPPGTTSPGQNATATPIPLWWFAAGAAGAAIVLVLILLMRRGSAPVVLRPDDEKIMAFVKSRGGRVYASDIVNSLGMPKSSVWKALRRLEANGLIKTRKDGNRVVVEA